MMNKALTLVSTEQDDEYKTETYACDVTVKLAGDSCWDCTLTEVQVKSISITEGILEEDEDEDEDEDGNTEYRVVNVYYEVDGDDAYEGSWRLYSDTGFQAAISNLLDFNVYYTEQGMQEDGCASME